MAKYKYFGEWHSPN